MITEEVQLMLKDYFEVLYTQDLVKFDQVFNQGCVLYSAQEGSVVVRPIAEYREIIAGRKSPQELGSLRKEEVLMIDILSPEIAFAKVRLRLNEHIMVDYLNLLKVEGKWTIAAKFYHREG
ncbi:nuclear transport factor 2 family protein [Pedobacter sp. PAMC26386]|nr:nuclear transport factor 2 family protein [Pedobacter sp. PAMC26386]